MVKGSTGFAFHRTQRDSRRIVASLEKEGHPFAVPAAPGRYRVMDAMLLHLLANRPELSERIFSDLFSKNPVERLFRFLDEQSSVGQDLAIMASVPWWPFIRAWLEIQVRRGL
jgi:lycopene beta-cyclase